MQEGRQAAFYVGVQCLALSGEWKSRSWPVNYDRLMTKFGVTKRLKRGGKQPSREFVSSLRDRGAVGIQRGGGSDWSTDQGQSLLGYCYLPN